jgi:hypothetical protein
VLSCGIGDCVGSGSGVDRHTVEPIIGMAALPIRLV